MGIFFLFIFVIFFSCDIRFQKEREGHRDDAADRKE